LCNTVLVTSMCSLMNCPDAINFFVAHQMSSSHMVFKFIQFIYILFYSECTFSISHWYFILSFHVLPLNFKGSFWNLARLRHCRMSLQNHMFISMDIRKL
jgi:hypothetical protein